MKKIIVILFLSLIPTSVCFSVDSVGITKTNSSLWSNDTYEKIALAFLAAFLVFISSYLLVRRKEKKEKKELSYEITLNEAISKKESPIAKNISLRYKGTDVHNLTFISCNIKNSGELLIKDEELRFAFTGSKDTKLLEYYLDPIPEPELGVLEIEMDSNLLECKYKIAHLVKNSDISFYFIVSGDSPQIKIHNLNPNGDTTFNEKTINNKLGQQEELKFIISANIVLIAIFPIAHIMSLSHKVDYPSLSLMRRVVMFFLQPDSLWATFFCAINLVVAKSISNIVFDYFTKTNKKNSETIESSGGVNNTIVSAKDQSVVHILNSKSKD